MRCAAFSLGEVGNMCVYQEQGYEDRDDYLKFLASDFCVSEDTVFALADMLGSEEDFDGLVTALEEYRDDNVF
jgi:hypothetical protein